MVWRGARGRRRLLHRARRQLRRRGEDSEDEDEDDEDDEEDEDSEEDEDEDDEDSEEDAVPEAASEKEDSVPEEAASEKEDVDETKKKKKKKPRARRGGGARRSRRAALYDKWLAKLTPEQKDALDKLAEANAAELNKYKGLLPGKATGYVATRDATRDAERGLGEAPAAYEAERERVERERVQVADEMISLAQAFLEKDETAKGLVDKRPYLPEQLSQRLVAQLEAPEATRRAGERLELSAPRYGLSIGSFAPPPFHRERRAADALGRAVQPVDALRAHELTQGCRAELGRVPGAVRPLRHRARPAVVDVRPPGFLEYCKKEDPDLYERMLVSNAHQFAHLVRSCGGFENVALLGLATRDIGEENVITWWVRESYAHDPAREIFEELATSAEEFIGAVLFRYHPSNYLYPERTPSSVDGIKRNDLADSCFLSFVFGDKGKDGAIVSTTGIDAYLHDPGFAEAIALLRAAHLRLLHEQLRNSPSSAQVANWARFGETHWARGTNDRSPGQPWSKEEEAHLLAMAEKESREWTEILAADRKNPQPIFAHGRTAKQLGAKHGRLIAAAANGAAANGESTVCRIDGCTRVATRVEDGLCDTCGGRKCRIDGCEHKSRRRDCKLCSPTTVAAHACEHKSRRRDCKLCSPTAAAAADAHACEHKTRRYRCKLCSPTTVAATKLRRNAGKTPTKAKTSSARTAWTTSQSEALAAGVKAHGASK